MDEEKRLSRLVDDSVLLRLDHFVVVLILVVVAILWCRGRGRGMCWCVFVRVVVVVVIMISSSGIIDGGLNLRGGVRTFGLLTNGVVNF